MLDDLSRLGELGIATALAEDKPDLVQRFVDASAIGWYHYLYGDNSKANAIIKAQVNASMVLSDLKAVAGGAK